MAPPPDDYGWAYVDAQRATASADGPSGSLQFRWGSEDLVPGQFSGSADLVFYPNSLAHNASTADTGNADSQDMSGSSLYLYGNMFVSGAVHAETYTIRQVTSTEVQVSGSTQFGDTADDTHQRTGSFEVLGQSNFTGDMQIKSTGNTDVPVLSLYSHHTGQANSGPELDFLRFMDSSLTEGDNLGEIRFRGAESNSDGMHSITRVGVTLLGEVGQVRDGNAAWVDGSSHPGRFSIWIADNGSDAVQRRFEIDADGATNISGALGPLSGSGEVHAHRFVSNDIFTSGSVHVGGSDPLAQPAEKNDLVIGNHTGNRGMTIASTPTGVGTIRFAGNTNANDGEGWIDYSGNTKKFRLGTDGLNTRVQIDSVGTQVTGTLEVSSNATFNSDVQIRSTTNTDTPVLGLYSFSDDGANSAAELDFRRYYDSSLVTGDNLGEIRFKAGETEGFSTAANNAVTLIAEVGSIQTGTATWTDGASHPGRFGIWIADNGQSGVQRRFEIEADGRTNISGALGPLTGSGEVHVAKLVGNDLSISGSSILGTNSTDGTNVDTHVIKGNAMLTGTLAVSSNTIIEGDLLVSEYIRHHPDGEVPSDTYFHMYTDGMTFRAGSNNMLTMRSFPDASGSQGHVQINGGTNAPDIDFFMYSTDVAKKAFHVRALDPLISHPQVNSSMHISAALGPVTGSGEVHVAKLVGNDLAVSGSSILGTNSTDGANVDTHVIKGNVMHTGSLGVSANAIVGNELHVGSYIRHLDDGEAGHSDTYFHFTEDKVQLRIGSANATTWGGTNLASTGSNFVSFNADGADVDFFIRGSGDSMSETKFNFVANDTDVTAGAQLHISAALGPVTGSGEIHAAKLVGNDLAISGSSIIGSNATNTHQITGSLEVSSDTIIAGDLLVDSFIRHNADGEVPSDTYIAMATDQMTFRAGSTNMLRIYGSDASGSQNAIALNNSSNTDDNNSVNDTDFYMLDGHYNAGGNPKFHFYLRGNDPQVATNGSLHITASLGPITGSGEVHVAKLVANDLALSSSAIIGAVSTEDTVQITGSLGVMTNIVTPASLYVGQRIYHTGDDDTMISFRSDEIDIYGGGIALQEMDVTDPSTGTGTIKFNKNGENLDFYVKGDGAGAGTWALHIDADGHSSTVPSVDMSGVLGPLTSSGEIHAAGFTGNSINLSGSKASPSLLVGANAPAQAASAGNTLAAIAGSGSSHALLVKGGLSASHDVKVEHLYTNDLYISGTAYGITVDRSNYASASSPSTARTYSPTGFETSGYLYVSGSSILGTAAADTHVITGHTMMTGTLEVSDNAFFNGTVHAAGVLLHKDDSDTGISLAPDQVVFLVGNQTMLSIVEGASTDKVVINDGGNDVDFRVESSVHTSSLLVDGATGNVNIGGDVFTFDTTGVLRVRPDTSNKARLLLHSRDATETDEAQLEFNRYNDGTFAEGDNLGIIQFRGAETEDGTYYTGASILAEVDEDSWTDGSSTAGRLVFYTTPDGATAGTEKMAINNAGHVSMTGSLNVTGEVEVGTNIHVGQYIYHAGDPDTRIRFLGDEMVLTAGGINFINLKENSTDPDTFKVNPANKDVDFYIYGKESSADAGDGGIAIHVDGDASGEGLPSLTPKVNISGALGPLSGSGEIHATGFTGNDINVSGSLTLGNNGLFKMADNTAAKILVADGTSFQEVAISGDISISSAGAVTIANDAVEQAMIADDAVGTSQIEDSAITNAKIDNGTIKADKLDIDGSTDIGAALVDADLIIVDDGGAGTNRKAAMSRIKTYTKTDISTAGTAEASKFVLLDASKNIATLGTVGCGAITSTGASTFGSVSGSSTLQIQGSASFGAPVDISGDLVFHCAATAGLIDIKVNDGAGADTAIQIGKNGKVTKIGDDTPGDGQYLSWDATAGKVAWADGLTVWGMSGSDAHYSSTELRTSGDLSVSGSVTLGGISAGTPTSNLFLGLDSNNNIVKAAANPDYTSDGAEIVFGADSEVKLVHDPDAGLIITRTATGDNQPATLTLKSGETAITNNNTIGEIDFKSSDSSGGDAGLVLAQIKAVASATHNTTVNSTSLEFATATDDAAATRLELTADGELKGVTGNASNWNINNAGTGSFAQLVINDRLIHASDTDTFVHLEPNSLKLHAGTTDQPQITITQDGVVINEKSNGTCDFRVETNSEANMLFVDANANTVNFAGGIGSSGITMVTTGSMRADGHIYTEGGFYTAGDLEVNGNILVNGTHPFVSDGGDPAFGTVAVGTNIVHTGDVNTKIAFTTDAIGFEAGGREFLKFTEDTQDVIRFNSANADVDFQVSTAASSGSLLIDGDTGDVHLCGDKFNFDHSEGILHIRPGTSDQAQIILSSRDATTTDDAMLTFRRYTDGTFADEDNLGIIEWRGAETEDGTYYQAAAIMAEVDEAAWADGTSAAGRLRFFTTPDGSTTGTEALKLESNGNATFAGSIKMEGSTLTGPTGASLSLRSDGHIHFIIDDDNNSTSNEWRWYDDNTERMVLNQSGDLQLDGDLTVSGNDIKDSGDNTVLSFDGNGNINNDLTIQATTANLDLVSTNGEGSIKFYGDGSSMVADDNVGSIRWYGTEDDGTGNSTQMGYMLVETTEAFSYSSAVGTRMKFAVGKAGTTDTVETMFVTGESGAGRVGIGTSSPDFKLSVAASNTGDAGFVGYFNNTSTGTTADGIRIRVGRTTNPTSNNTFIQLRNGNSAVGKVIGDSSGGVSFIDAFTGRHPTVTADPVGNLLIGLILSSTGEMWLRNEDTVSTGLPKVSLATSDNDKAVFGVLSRIETSENPEEYWYGGYHSTENIGEGETPIVVNSMGEGLVWVTNKNGEVERGDYICSTVVPGYGGKQADDLLHSYTVAKCVETIDWASVTDTIEHDGVTYKRYLAACTYNCG